MDTDIILYLKSFTTDNYLIGKIRVREIFNTAKIKNAVFTKGPKKSINASGVICKHYNVTVTFTDNTVKTFTAFVKSGPDTFTFTLTVGVNTLKDTHTAKVITITNTSTTKPTLNIFRNDKLNIPQLIVKYDDVVVNTDYYYPTSKESNIFTIPTIH